MNFILPNEYDDSEFDNLLMEDNDSDMEIQGIATEYHSKSVFLLKRFLR